MLHYDDRDYLDYNNIDELYDDYTFDEDKGDSEDPTWTSSWEYDYHNITDELIDD